MNDAMYSYMVAYILQRLLKKVWYLLNKDEGLQYDEENEED